MALAVAACRSAPALKEVQRVKTGDMEVVLLSMDGALHQKDVFTIEFRSSGGSLVNAGNVRASASMPMAGMPPMFGSIDVKPAGEAGRYTATASLEMAGGWRLGLEWDGPAGKGSVNFTGTVQ